MLVSESEKSADIINKAINTASSTYSGMSSKKCLYINAGNSVSKEGDFCQESNKYRVLEIWYQLILSQSMLAL